MLIYRGGDDDDGRNSDSDSDEDGGSSGSSSSSVSNSSVVAISLSTVFENCGCAYVKQVVGVAGGCAKKLPPEPRRYQLIRPFLT